jgi:hypothetical protein
VRQGRGELAHGAQPEGAVERFLIDAQLLLRALLLAHQHPDGKTCKG